MTVHELIEHLREIPNQEMPILDGDKLCFDAEILQFRVLPPEERLQPDQLCEVKLVEDALNECIDFGDSTSDEVNCLAQIAFELAAIVDELRERGRRL